MKFREAPKGELELKHGGTQLIRPKRVPGVVCKDQPKMAFSDEPVRKLAGRGHWFELRVEEFLGGEVCLLALGFTATNPDTLDEAELPGRAATIPMTYVAGYARSVYWNGEKITEVDNIFARVAPQKIFSIGVLVNLSGGLEVFVNRRLAISLRPEDHGKPPISTDDPLWAVVDASGGLKKATLVTESLPPSAEEAESPEETVQIGVGAGDAGQ